MRAGTLDARADEVVRSAGLTVPREPRAPSGRHPLVERVHVLNQDPSSHAKPGQGSAIGVAHIHQFTEDGACLLGSGPGLIVVVGAETFGLQMTMCSALDEHASRSE